MISSLDNTKQTFTGFAKLKGNVEKLNPIAESIKEILPDSFIFYADKSKQNRTLYILTGKHQNKFINCIKKTNNFMNLKKNIEKYIGKKAQKLKVNKVKQDIQKGTLKI